MHPYTCVCITILVFTVSSTQVMWHRAHGKFNIVVLLMREELAKLAATFSVSFWRWRVYPNMPCTMSVICGDQRHGCCSTLVDMIRLRDPDMFQLDSLEFGVLVMKPIWGYSPCIHMLGLWLLASNLLYHPATNVMGCLEYYWTLKNTVSWSIFGPIS